LREDIKAVIDKLIIYKALFTHSFKVREINLFGSYANIIFHNYSYIDLAIFIDKMEGDYFEYTPLLWKLRRILNFRIEHLLFEDGKDESGFLITIKKNELQFEFN